MGPEIAAPQIAQFLPVLLGCLSTAFQNFINSPTGSVYTKLVPACDSPTGIVVLALLFYRDGALRRFEVQPFTYPMFIPPTSPLRIHERNPMPRER